MGVGVVVIPGMVEGIVIGPTGVFIVLPPVVAKNESTAACCWGVNDKLFPVATVGLVVAVEAVVVVGCAWGVGDVVGIAKTEGVPYPAPCK